MKEAPGRKHRVAWQWLVGAGLWWGGLVFYNLPPQDFLWAFVVGGLLLLAAAISVFREG